LKENIKARNVMYVDGLKHNFLSASPMCDQGNEVVFQSNGCVIHELDTGKTIIKCIITQNNLYILKGGQKQCYLSKTDENELWHRRLGHLIFSQIRKSCRLKEVHDLPDIIITKNTICKPCLVNKQPRVHLSENEGSTSKPLELIHTNLCGPTRKKSPRGEQ